MQEDWSCNSNLDKILVADFTNANKWTRESTSSYPILFCWAMYRNDCRAVWATTTYVSVRFSSGPVFLIAFNRHCKRYFWRRTYPNISEICSSIIDTSGSFSIHRALLLPGTIITLSSLAHNRIRRQSSKKHKIPKTYERYWLHHSCSSIAITTETSIVLKNNGSAYADQYIVYFYLQNSDS